MRRVPKGLVPVRRVPTRWALVPVLVLGLAGCNAEPQNWRDLQKHLASVAPEQREAAIETFIAGKGGTPIIENQTRLLFLAKDKDGQTPRIVGIDTRRDVVRLGPDDFDAPPRRVATIELPREYAPRNPGYRKQVADRLRSAKLRDDRVTVVEGLADIEPRTKAMKGIIERFPASRSWLIVMPEKIETIERAAGNLPNVWTIMAANASSTTRTSAWSPRLMRIEPTKAVGKVTLFVPLPVRPGALIVSLVSVKT